MTNADHYPARHRGARFHVHADRVLDWLATAVDSIGDSFADSYGLADHDTFRRGGEDMHDRIQMLVEQAQPDGILTAPDHLLTLWQIGDEGFLLTIDPPSPPRLCSLHLTVGDLLPDRTSGGVAALAVLMVANQLLDEQSWAHAARGSVPAAFRGIQQRQPTGPELDALPGASPADPTGTRRPNHGR